MALAAHYMMVGLKPIPRGETNIEGLFAAGEVACTGVHGANRLASNSMLEVLIFSKRIIERTTSGTQGDSPQEVKEIRVTLSENPEAKATKQASIRALQDLMWSNVGIIRDREGLEKAVDTLAAWYRDMAEPTDRPSYELCNLVLTGRLVAEAALKREESRGAHFRSDYPQHSPQWEQHITFTRG